MKAYTDYSENMLEYSLVADSSKYLDLYDKPLFYINNVIKPRNLAP
jgi:hypothetical protein